MKYVAIAAGIILIGLAVGVVFWASRPAKKQPAPPTSQKPATEAAGEKEAKKEPMVEARGIEIERRDEIGRLKWKLVASGKMRADKERGIVVTEDVRWTLETPDKTWKATAKRATMKEAGGDVVLDGGVQLSTTDGQIKIKTGRARYEMKTGRLVMEGPVNMQAGEASINAERAVVDLKNHVLRAVGVRGKYSF